MAFSSLQKKITDSTDVYDHLMQRPNVLQRLNQHVTASDSLQLDLSTPIHSPIPEITHFNSLSSHSKSALLVQEMVYYTNPEGRGDFRWCSNSLVAVCVCTDEFAVRPVSLWLVADLGSEQGRQLVTNALSYLVPSSVVQDHNWYPYTHDTYRQFTEESSLAFCITHLPPLSQTWSEQ